jgi:hypothetical protein
MTVLEGKWGDATLAIAALQPLPAADLAPRFDCFARNFNVLRRLGRLFERRSNKMGFVAASDAPSRQTSARDTMDDSSAQADHGQYCHDYEGPAGRVQFTQNRRQPRHQPLRES